MSDAIGQVLSFAVAAGLSPIPIIGVVLMLGSPRGRSNGPAFVVGWVVSIMALGGVVLAVAGGAGADDSLHGPAYVKLALGVLLLLIALRQWRGRPKEGEQPEPPKWMAAIDSFTAPRSAALAFALAVVNPKNLVLVVGAAVAIAQTGAATGDQVVALAVFTLVATLGVGTPVAMYFAMGERSKDVLDDLKSWMARNNGAIMAVICLLIGAKLIGDAIGGLGG
jgi:threonine/homoserine/homoserine lactone efflux protein